MFPSVNLNPSHYSLTLQKLYTCGVIITLKKCTVMYPLILLIVKCFFLSSFFFFFSLHVGYELWSNNYGINYASITARNSQHDLFPAATSHHKFVLEGHIINLKTIVDTLCSFFFFLFLRRKICCTLNSDTC